MVRSGWPYKLRTFHFEKFLRRCRALEEYEWDDLVDADAEELEEIVDEEDLEVDVEDFEDDEDGLRKAVAKALGIKVPAEKKKKKKK